MPAYLTAIASAMGEPFPVESLPEIRDAGLKDWAIGEGLRDFRVADQSQDLTRASIEVTLAMVGDTEPIDLVVYCCCSIRRQFDDIGRLLASFQLRNVPLITVEVHGCGNFGIGLRIARDAVLAGTASRVLLITFDRVETGFRRFIPESTVMSDGAATCLITNERPASGFSVLGIATTIDSIGMSAKSRPDKMTILRAASVGIPSALEQLFRQTGTPRGAFGSFVMNNYGRSSQRIFASIAGIGGEKVYTPRLASHAHCFSADIAMGLSDMETAESPDPSPILAVMNGYHSWTCAELSRVSPR